MKRFQSAILAAVLLFAAVPCTWAQQPQEPDMDQIINSQLENLTRSFKLDEVQVFFVDSVLQHNFPAMTQEFEDTRRTGASNQETYQIISDKSRLLDDVVGQGESWLGKMPDDEIMQLVRVGKGA